MQKKIISVLLIIFLVVVFSGCQKNKAAKNNITPQNNNSAKIAPENKVQKEPPVTSLNEEQKKYPLPDGSKPYTGIIKKLAGSKITIDIAGVDYEVEITDKTNLQKGNQAGTGKLEQLKPQMKIDVLAQGGKALSVHYE